MKKEIILESEIKERYNELIMIFKKLKQLKKDGRFSKAQEIVYNSLKKDMNNTSGTMKVCEDRGYMDNGIKIILNLSTSRLLQKVLGFYECFVLSKQRYEREEL